MKLLKQLLCYIFAMSILATTVLAFPDVTTDYEWAIPSITTLSQKGYLSGYPDGTFAPGKNITRAEFAKLVTAMFGKLSPVSYEDVLEDDWFYPHISQSGGYFLFAEQFLPNRSITRQEVAYAISVALKLTGSPMDKSIPFSDMTDVDEQYLPAVMALNRAEILNGYPDGTFGPNKNITRAEIATVLERAQNYIPPKTDDPTEEITENTEESTATAKANTYFFVVSRVSTVYDEHKEIVTKVEGYQNGTFTTILIDDNTTIHQNRLATDDVISSGDIISYFTDAFGNIRHLSIGLNANNLPRENCIEMVSIGDTLKKHIAVGTVLETYKQKAIDLVSLVGSTKKSYDIGDPVYVYEITSNGKIQLCDFSEITDSRYETGDTVVAFSYDDVLQEILVIKE